MKQLHLTASIALALALTACGGGSPTTGGTPYQTVNVIGGGTTTIGTATGTTATDTSNADAADTATNTGTTGTGTPTTTTDPNATLRIAGNVIAIDGNKIAGGNQVTGTSNNLDKIIIGGQTIDVYPAGITGTINRINVETGVGRLVSTTPNSRFGYLQENVGSTPYFFSQGNISANVPVANSIKYEGTAVYFNQGNQDKLKNPTGLIHLGTNPQSDEEKVTFLANFTNKTITGNLAGVVQLQGTIVDNGFSGELNGISTNGYFYGDNAAELGGTYRNADGTVSGAYGATKTE